MPTKSIFYLVIVCLYMFLLKVWFNYHGARIWVYSGRVVVCKIRPVEAAVQELFPNA